MLWKIRSHRDVFLLCQLLTVSLRRIIHVGRLLQDEYLLHLWTLPHPAQVHCPLTDSNRDKNLGQGLCIFTSFHFPDSRLYLLNGFDFYFDLFWMAWLKTSNKNLRIRDIRWSRNLRAVCWCRGEALKVRKLPLRLSAGVVCRPPPVFKRNLGRRKKLAEKVGRRKIYSPVPPPSKNNWWHGG